MSKTKTIPLSKPLIGHDEPVREIKVRAPNLAEYGSIGEPFTWARPSDDAPAVYIENDAAISRYLDVCIVEPKDKNLLAQIELEDAMTLKEEILGFFLEARLARASRSSPTGSSSTSG
jgi:hypothetical protein